MDRELVFVDFGRYTLRTHVYHGRSIYHGRIIFYFYRTGHQGIFYVEIRNKKGLKLRPFHFNWFNNSYSAASAASAPSAPSESPSLTGASSASSPSSACINARVVLTDTTALAGESMISTFSALKAPTFAL